MATNFKYLVTLGARSKLLSLPRTFYEVNRLKMSNINNKTHKCEVSMVFSAILGLFHFFIQGKGHLASFHRYKRVIF